MKQLFSVSMINLASLHSRLGASSVVVIGIAGVVFVLTALFAMANGLRATLTSTGHSDRVLILGGNAVSEINGAISPEQAAIIVHKPGIAAAVTANGVRQPLASPEIYATATIERRDSSGRAGVPIRGVSPEALRVRPEVQISRGRTIEPGRFEMIVGSGAAHVFAGLRIGDDVALKGASFRVVGHFDAAGSATESEAWIDANVMANVFNRGGFVSTVLARLDTPSGLDALRDAINADRRLTNTLLLESDYYLAQSGASTQMITIVGIVTGCIMALGAVFAALNSLYAAVSARTREIAILRALGFSALPVIGSVLAESLALALIGGITGAAAGWLAFDGLAMSSIGATFTQVAFNFAVTPALMLSGVGLALSLGLIGGLLPALHAARQNVIEGLRAK